MKIWEDISFYSYLQRGNLLLHRLITRRYKMCTTKNGNTFGYSTILRRIILFIWEEISFYSYLQNRNLLLQLLTTNKYKMYTNKHGISYCYETNYKKIFFSYLGTIKISFKDIVAKTETSPPPFFNNVSQKYASL